MAPDSDLPAPARPTASLVAIVEDDPAIAALVARSLQEHGFESAAFGSAAAFLEAAPRLAPDLLLLDLGLPDGDGIALLPRLQEAPRRLPVIILSGRAADADRIVGLELGADDYVAKPFNARELVARVRSVLRRARAPGEPPPAARAARFLDFRYDPATYLLCDPAGGETMLGSAEARLLEAFLEAPNRVLTRDHLLRRAARDDSLDRAIDVGVSRLRKKLAEAGCGRNPIRTVYGAGYMFTAAVDWS